MDIKRLARKRDQFKEISLMQLEEINALKQRLQETGQFIAQLRTKIVTDRQPHRDLFNKQQIEAYIGKEDQILQKFIGENEHHLQFLRKIIEKEFFHNNEESISFYQKFSIKTFEEMRPKLKVSSRAVQNQASEEKANTFLEKNNISFLKLTKPNMFEMVRSRALNMTNDEIQKLLDVSFDVLKLIRSVRGMMDSYWSMMQIYSDPRQYCTFCEFAYVWIGSYRVDLTTNKTVELSICRFL